ncbi:hypothetical protein KIPB_011069 [Kipferlia bialata]|uniref:Uncharacterized protein n=1 Tax=Kipferlia bialata TaxID=797122 RepID=A0A9K3D5Y5_9EUKA|nr:hypothetical protein KIPB_011069 [Kipferlia bialata]|eukprot:g11069.t1
MLDKVPLRSQNSLDQIGALSRGHKMLGYLLLLALLALALADEDYTYAVDCDDDACACNIQFTWPSGPERRHTDQFNTTLINFYSNGGDVGATRLVSSEKVFVLATYTANTETQDWTNDEPADKMVCGQGLDAYACVEVDNITGGDDGSYSATIMPSFNGVALDTMDINLQCNTQPQENWWDCYECVCHMYEVFDDGRAVHEWEVEIEYEGFLGEYVVRQDEYTTIGNTTWHNILGRTDRFKADDTWAHISDDAHDIAFYKMSNDTRHTAKVSTTFLDYTGNYAIGDLDLSRC